MFNPNRDNLRNQPPLAGNGNSGPGWTPYTGAIHNRSVMDNPELAGRYDNPTVINPAGPTVGDMTGVSAPAAMASQGGVLGVAPVSQSAPLDTRLSDDRSGVKQTSTTTHTGHHIGKDLGTTTGLSEFEHDFTHRRGPVNTTDDATLTGIGYGKPIGTTAYDSAAMPTAAGTGNVGTVNTRGLDTTDPLGATSTGYGTTATTGTGHGTTSTGYGLGSNTTGLSATEAPLGATSTGYGLGSSNTSGLATEAPLGATSTGYGLGSTGTTAATGQGYGYTGSNTSGLASNAPLATSGVATGTSAVDTEHAPSKATAYSDKLMGSVKKGVGAVFSENLREKGMMQKAQGEAELEANRVANEFKRAAKEHEERL